MTATTEPDWHGYDIGGVSYYVGRHPARKSVALMRSTEGVVEAAAYFRTQEQAESFLAWLDQLAKSTPPHTCQWTGSGLISHDALCVGCGKRYGDLVTENGRNAPPEVTL